MTRAGRPPTPKGEERREQILDAARERLATRGWAALTMRGVASDVGIALGHLQHYFTTLPALVEAVLARELARGRERLREGLAREHGLDAIIDVLLADHDDPALVSLFVQLWALAAHDAEVRAPLAGFYREYREAIVDALVARGLAPDRGRARGRAERFLAALEGLALFRSGVASTSRWLSAAQSRQWLRSILDGP